jgi:hypothetical protein
MIQKLAVFKESVFVRMPNPVENKIFLWDDERRIHREAKLSELKASEDFKDLDECLRFIRSLPRVRAIFDGGISIVREQR